MYGSSGHVCFFFFGVCRASDQNHTCLHFSDAARIAGLLLPIILTMQEVMRFLKKKSPEVDMLETWSGLSRNRLQLMLLAGVLLQCHMLLLTFLSIQGRQVHPLLAGAKFAEAVGKNELGESGPRLDIGVYWEWVLTL